MPKSITLDPKIKKELDRCVRCGTCMKVCPVYEVMQREGGVARGKLMLVEARQAGALDGGSRYRHYLSACLLCGRCKSSCPNEVDTPLVVQAARAELAKGGRIGWFKSFVLRRLLPARRLLPGLLKGARASRALWAAKLPGDSGLHLRFMRGPGGERRRLPPLASPFFLQRGHPEPKPTGHRVALFVGCVANYLRPEVAQAAAQALAAAGAAVVIPRDQGCCGLPAFVSGEDQAARALARRNLEALLPAGQPWPESITTPCASCAFMLAKQVPELLAGEEALAERVRELARRVVPFSTLWARLRNLKAEGPARKAAGPGPVLTYHDPCHLSRGFGEKETPRFLLTALPGTRFVEQEHPCSCCGHGGSFNVSHYDLSLGIAAVKVRRVLATGADILVTECSGCQMQLAEAMARAGSRMEVISTPEALARFDPACRAAALSRGASED